VATGGADSVILPIIGVVLAAVLAIAAKAIIGDLAISGARGLLLALAENYLVRAAAQMPEDIVEDLLNEWHADLRVRFSERGPIAGLVWARGIALRGAPRITRSIDGLAPRKFLARLRRPGGAFPGAVGWAAIVLTPLGMCWFELMSAFGLRWGLVSFWPALLVTAVLFAAVEARGARLYRRTSCNSESARELQVRIVAEWLPQVGMVVLALGGSVVINFGSPQAGWALSDGFRWPYFVITVFLFPVLSRMAMDRRRISARRRASRRSAEAALRR
jgi:hypothetical protein